eukprot:scaffold72009_cov60-Phaeocystis_antarctica.AAC.1
MLPAAVWQAGTRKIVRVGGRVNVSAKGGGRPVGGALVYGRGLVTRAVSPWRDHGGAIVRRDYSSLTSEGAGSSHKVYTVRAYLRLGAPLLLVPAAQLRQTSHAREGHPLGRPRLRPRRRRRRRRRPRLRPPG